MNITSNMIKMLPLFSLYLMKRNEKSVRCWKHDQVFSKVQRGVKKNKKQTSPVGSQRRLSRSTLLRSENVSAPEQFLSR